MEEIISNYEFEEVWSGHLIMSENDLHNLMKLWAYHENEELKNTILIQSDRINEHVNEIKTLKSESLEFLSRLKKNVSMPKIGLKQLSQLEELLQKQTL